MGPTRVLGGVSFFSGHFLKTSLSHCTQQDLLLLSPAQTAALCFMDLTSPAPVTASRLSVRPAWGGHSQNVLIHPQERGQPWGRGQDSCSHLGTCRDVQVCVCACAVWSITDSVRAPGGFGGAGDPLPWVTPRRGPGKDSPSALPCPRAVHHTLPHSSAWCQGDSVLALSLLSWHLLTPNTMV